jgi:hypothetical protein
MVTIMDHASGGRVRWSVVCGHFIRKCLLWSVVRSQFCPEIDHGLTTGCIGCITTRHNLILVLYCIFKWEMEPPGWFQLRNFDNNAPGAQCIVDIFAQAFSKISDILRDILVYIATHPISSLGAHAQMRLTISWYVVMVMVIFMVMVVVIFNGNYKGGR